MKLTGLDVLDTTVDRTNCWLGDVMQELNWADRRQAYLALRCVLHAIRDHLSADDAAQFADSLPMLIRGFYFEHWVPSKPPLRAGSKEEFLSCVRREISARRTSLGDPEVIVRGVFRVLDRKATEGEILNPCLKLPGAVQSLWPSELRAA